MGSEGGIREKGEEWMEEPEGFFFFFFLPNNTFIIVTFHLGGTFVSFMGCCLFLSSHSSEDSLGYRKNTQVSTSKFMLAAMFELQTAICTSNNTAKHARTRMIISAFTDLMKQGSFKR